MDVLAALGLAGLLLIKEAGVPIPIPGDLLVIGAGVATAGDPVAALGVLIAVLIAGYVGGSIQFLLARGALRKPLIAILTRFGLPQARIEALADRLRRGGARGVAIARATPGVRVPAIAASGVAALPLKAFAPGLVAGNTLFVGLHFLLGFVVGVPAIALIEAYGFVLIAAAVGILAIVGAVGWLVLRRRRAQQRAAAPDRETSGFAAWADAACPACLGVAFLRGQ